MTRRLIIIAVLTGIIAMAANASATGNTFATPEEAAQAGLIEMLDGGWPVVGMCDSKSAPRSGDVCLRTWQLAADGPYRIYSAAPHGYADINWWIGVKKVEGDWIPYDGGPVYFTYSRVTDPDGNVIFGYPDGDANQDGFTDSLDALSVLQSVARAVEIGETPLNYFANVDQSDGLNSSDALLILQSYARLIPGLPIRLGEPPFEDK